MLGQLVEIGVGEARGRPSRRRTAAASSWRTAARRPTSPTRCAGSARPGIMQQADVLVLRQPLQRGGDGLGDRLHRIGDALQMCGQPVQEVGRPRARAAATSSASVLGKYRYTVWRVTPSVRATSAMEKSAPRASIALPAASRMRVMASSSVAGADPDQPWVRTPRNPSVSPGRRPAAP